MKDSLGDRMKENYENRTRYSLPRRTYTIIRVDGKSFKNYTKNMVRPFDNAFILAMDSTAVHICEKIQGAQFAYVQSDEISILLTDFEKETTDAFFDGNLQKICSVSSSMATAFFNVAVTNMFLKGIDNNFPKEQAFFDSRVFTIPDPVEIYNYFVWRQKDCTRNAVTSVAQSLYSHKELHGKSSSEKQEMIFQKGQNFNDYPAGCKRGRFIKKEQEVQVITKSKIRGKTKLAALLDDADFEHLVVRNKWVVIEPPIFTQDRKFLIDLIPVIPQFEENLEEKNDSNI